jgi:hypothetical protein
MTCKVTGNTERHFFPQNVVRDLAFQFLYKEKENREERSKQYLHNRTADEINVPDCLNTIFVLWNF